MRFDITIPHWPPTVNHAYMTRPGGMRIRTPKMRNWMEVVSLLVAGEARRTGHAWKDPNGKFLCSLIARPPDNRRRDLDNIVKVVLDSIQASGIIKDDSQIKALFSVMLPKGESVGITVFLEEADGRLLGECSTFADFAAHQF